jgi:putative nucleotidyltransferase with HDIG domain
MKLPLRVKIYIVFIMLLSAISTYFVVIVNKTALVIMPNNGLSIDLLILLFWIMLAILTESLVLKLPSGMGLSVSLAIVLAALLSYGTLVGIIVTGSGYLFRIIKDVDTKKISHFFNTSPYKTFFNASQSMLAMGISGLIYTSIGGVPHKFDIWQTLVLALVYTILNSAIMSFFFSLLRKQKFLNSWISNMRGVLVNVILVGTMGIILFLAYESFGIGSVLLFLGPLLLARFSFKQYTDLRETYVETIKAFNKMTEAKDSYTGEHSSRVETYAVELAMHIGLSDKKVNDIRMASILHDIGKVGINDSVLKKPSSLTTEEYEMIKLHPNIGADIIKNVSFLKEVSIIIRHHHERYDGKGYPNHLKGSEIRTESAILALADVYDAITSNRAYRDPLNFEEAKKEIERNAGTQFDPKLTIEFLNLIDLKSEVFNRDDL